MGTTKRRSSLAGVVALVGVVAVPLLGQTVHSPGFQPNSAAAAGGRQVTQADVERWKQELTNWGRWGAEDERGTLNPITPAKRRQAAALVREGISVSLARDAEIEATIDGPRPYQVTPLGITADEIRVSYHGFIQTHLDFLKPQLHRRRPDLQRLPARSRRGRGAGRPRPEHRAQRQVGHRHPGRADRHGAVLERAVPGGRHADPRRGHRGLGGGDGGAVSAGDVVVIRTGRWARRAEVGPWDVANAAAGLHASVIPWLRERDIAILGGEVAQDMAPADADPAVTVAADLGPRPLHRFALIYLGMPLFDNLDLEAVGEVAASLNRYEFLLTAAPLPTRGTGSPINPIATF